MVIIFSWSWSYICFILLFFFLPICIFCCFKTFAFKGAFSVESFEEQGGNIERGFFLVLLILIHKLKILQIYITQQEYKYKKKGKKKWKTADKQLNGFMVHSYSCEDEFMISCCPVFCSSIFVVFWLWVYLMKGISETRRAYYIRYLRFYCTILLDVNVLSL